MDTQIELYDKFMSGSIQRHTQVEEKMIQMSSLVTTMISGLGAQMKENATQLEENTRQINLIGSKLVEQQADQNNKIDRLEKEMNNLQSGQVNVQSRLEFNDKYSRLWSVIPLLFDGYTGQCGWTPVTYGEKDLVVISLASIEFMVTTHFTGVVRTKTEVAVALDSIVEPITVGEGPLPRQDFLNILLRTNYRPYASGLARVKISGKNMERFIIVWADDWKRSIRTMRERFPHSVGRMPVGCESHPWNSIVTMTQDYSMSGDKVNFLKPQRSLTREEMERCPSTSVTWWREAYEGGTKKFFDIPECDEFYHVRNGVYDPESSPVESYSVVKSKWDSMKEENDSDSSDDEDETPVTKKRKLEVEE